MLENLQFFPTYHRGIREPGFAYGLFLVILPIINVKIAMTRRQSAGVRSISTSEASQRLHAEDLTSVYSRFIPAQTPQACGGLKLEFLLWPISPHFVWGSGELARPPYPPDPHTKCRRGALR